MDSRKAFLVIRRKDTSNLLILKMKRTKQIAFVTSLKSGVLALFGLQVGKLVETLLSDNATSSTMYFVILVTFLFVIVYLSIDYFLSHLTSTKQLIQDLLEIRLSRTGKRGLTTGRVRS